MKKPLPLIFIWCMLFSGINMMGQVAINADGANPDASAMLEVKSTTKGFLPPRMTQSERDAISNPVPGLTVYNSDKNEMEFFNGTVWRQFQTGFSMNVNCGSDFVDLRDGKIYKTLQIGTQCWMAENMNVGLMINGTLSQSNNDTIEKYCYNDDPANCDTYGGLYQWNEMMQFVTVEGAQGICPAGWHIPNETDWCTLVNEVDTTTVDCDLLNVWVGAICGGNLKETGTTHWNSPNTGASDSSRFTILPSGYRGSTGTYNSMGGYAYMLSSTEVSSSNAWQHTFAYSSAKTLRGYANKNSGYAVRCVRD